MVCLKSDVLCNACQERLESGKISKSDLEVSRFLYGMEDKFKGLQNAKLIKTIEGDNIIIVTGYGDAARFVGRQGSVVKLLAKHFNKSIKVVEFSPDIKTFVRDLVPNAVVNILYTKEGEKYKIMTRGHVASKEEVENIIKNIFGKPAEVVMI